ncbi:MAG: hypothetical protein PVF70_11550, partial [Anaerolineales bacterium]
DLRPEWAHPTTDRAIQFDPSLLGALGAKVDVNRTRRMRQGGHDVRPVLCVISCCLRWQVQGLERERIGTLDGKARK